MVKTDGELESLIIIIIVSENVSFVTSLEC